MTASRRRRRTFWQAEGIGRRTSTIKAKRAWPWLLALLVLAVGVGAFRVARVGSAPSPTSLGAGQSLTPGQSLEYGPYVLKMTTSGYLMAGGPGWWTAISSKEPSGSSLEVEADGTVAIVAPGGESVWKLGSAPGGCLVGGSTLGMVDGSPVAFDPADSYHWWPLWSVTPCYVGNQSGPRVAVIGDSITNLSQSAVVGALEPDYGVQVSGMVGLEWAQQMPALQALLANPAGPPQDFIFNLGTNDAVLHDPNWQEGMNEVLSDVPSHSCTLLVGISPWAGSDRVVDDMNTAMLEWVKEHPSAHFINWTARVEKDPGLLYGDHIHPTPSGSKVLAGLYLRALETDC